MRYVLLTPSSVDVFTGLYHDDDDVDVMLVEHFDALGHNFSFRSWD